MKIVALKPRRGHLTAVFTDEGDEPVLINSDVAEELLTIGAQLTDLQLETVILRSNERRALDRALYNLGFRDHSEKELRDKLSRLFGKEAADFAVGRVRELGLVNDLTYARAKAADLINLRGFSGQRVKRELAAKGIDRETVSAVLDELSIDGVKAVCEIIDRRFTPLPTDEKGKRRMMNYLISRGYGWSDIRQALERRGENTED